MTPGYAPPDGYLPANNGYRRSDSGYLLVPGGADSSFPSEWLGVTGHVYFGANATATTWPPHLAGDETLVVTGSSDDPSTGQSGPSNANYSELDGGVTTNPNNDGDGGKFYAAATGSFAAAGSNSFAVEFVAKFPQATGYGAVMGHRDHSDYKPGYALQLRSNTQLHINWWADGFGEQKLGSNVITADTWYHFIAFVDATADKMQHFRNGTNESILHSINDGPVSDGTVEPLEWGSAFPDSSGNHQACMTTAYFGIYVVPGGIANADFATLASDRYNDLFSGDPDGP